MNIINDFEIMLQEYFLVLFMLKKLSPFILITLLILSFSCKNESKQNTGKTEINNHWEFWQEKEDIKYRAKVPGNIHLDLINNHLISQPYYANNEKKLKWIENKNWIYETHFSFSKNKLSKSKINLIFEGLDTYAHVYLNEVQILKANNMFLEYSINVKELLKKDNILRVEFLSAVKEGEYLYDEHEIQLPADNDRNEKATSVYTRKAPFQYGWDWGPRFVGVGIWKPIYLEFWEEWEIQESRVYQKKLLKEKAIIAWDLEVNSMDESNVDVEVFQNEQLVYRQNFNLNEGLNNITDELDIKNPKLWWPNGSGDAHLYRYKLRITSQNQEWEKDFNIGFKTIELQRKKDSIGESFSFIINGEPIYMKGANYIPQDVFPSRIVEQDYQKILAQCRSANMNMLRVWGGGVYEKDEFYEICDKLGILVWQDFMFACSLYPGDSAFLNNIEQEATFQIKRLRDHASLALWCGNNEINELWHNWGYQKAYSYSKADSTETWHNYLAIFDTLLPELVQQNSAQIPYLESSPVIGWGHKESITSGDSHYWGVWWGKQAFEKYEEKIPRFSSEFGFQSLPHLNTILSFTDSSQLSLFSEDMKAHQKSSIGNQTILEYLPNYYPKPSNFKELIYVSQLLQAYGMGLAFQAQRFSKPYCMGTLYWQLNDCWPGLSWSSIDYYGQKKATHYLAKKDFSNFMIKSKLENKGLHVSIVSDSLQDILAKLSIAMVSFEGDTIQLSNTDVLLKANQVKTIYVSEYDYLEFNPAQTFIYSKLSKNSQVLAESIDFLNKPKDLDLPSSGIKIDSLGANKFLVYSSLDNFNYSVYLSTSIFGNFEPNFFHLLPSDSIKVEFVPRKKGRVILVDEIEVISLNSIGEND